MDFLGKTRNLSGIGNIWHIQMVSAAGFEPTAPGFISPRFSSPLIVKLTINVCKLDCLFTVEIFP
ncbi:MULTISPECIES: hypothetical protein [unclassified Commensalibacter]|uniref:hypothetical protein n=1 Tax=unclassified Commensalibacter TaxID=2630218 RepID=UPI001E2DB907|nr:MULTISPECIES: hypothetical protein [unclassified Commensalibacter]